ncbi:hypothetical protein KP79_PYT01109 [Mizuhopecten yessoensis]|uniref:Uncharacterized protein n=1 Tax=Mizuhopecten yessoensis TaxID=6573 RepID=A0A210QK40_MIZYE|nr:hypothetical protein KP79_PYT01109 [Mizuhopecten yessoensis]
MQWSNIMSFQSRHKTRFILTRMEITEHLLYHLSRRYTVHMTATVVSFVVTAASFVLIFLDVDGLSNIRINLSFSLLKLFGIGDEKRISNIFD